ncbi:uncharacterized protein LOC134209826 [Armigeres subalbatus]|uniref:uncharacterized protein LOC134209826 n=1 Tax=Armigeres subalbatus TaxID=124917 RepID=UPI002ECFD01E
MHFICTVTSQRNQKDLGELARALTKCNGNSSGPDEIGSPMLKRLPQDAKAQLLNLVNDTWENRTVLDEWKKSLVISILKNKVAGRDSAKYSKTMESMVNRRLREKLEADGIFGFQQHAFRPGYGTSTCFANLSSVLQSAHNEGKHVDLVSLDIAKALSRTWTPLVQNKLQEWGITGNMLAFIKNFLTGRT